MHFFYRRPFSGRFFYWGGHANESHSLDSNFLSKIAALGVSLFKIIYVQQEIK